MNRGRLIIFSAPSGAGKTTIVRSLIARRKDLSFSISATTRAPRGQEQDEVDYYFLSKEEFSRRVQKGDFVEYEEVYKDTFYGTLYSEVERIWESGKHVLFDIDVEGSLSLKARFKDDALSIFVQPPSLEVLKQRLEQRGTDTADKIEERFAKSRLELAYAPKFDVVIVNDDLQKACSEVEHVIDSFLELKRNSVRCEE